MAPQHQPRHAAPDTPDRTYNANLRSRGHTPRHAKGNHDNAPTIIRYTGHGLDHTYRADVVL